MAELSLAIDPNAGTTPAPDGTTAAVTPTDQGGNKGDLNVALSQSREAEKTLKAEKDALASEKAALEARIKEYELSQLPDEDRAEAEFRDLTIDKVLSDIDKEAFSKLPKAIQARLQKDPWALMDQADLDQATRFHEGTRDFYKKAGEAAKTHINELLKEYSPQEPKKADEPDPTIKPGTNGNDVGTKDIASYSQFELFKLRNEDPEKFKQIQKMARQQ